MPGPGAMLSHVTAASWLGLIDRASPADPRLDPLRRRSSPRGMLVHKRRTAARAGHPRMGSPPRRSRRRCSTWPPWVSSRSSAEDWPGWTTSTASTRARCWRCASGGRRGSIRRCRWAIAHFDPRFAFTRSPLEDDWLICCEQLDIPKPDDVNVKICGIRVDACYYDAMLIIEFDGTDNHRSPAQVRRDRRNEFKLRTAGWMVLRYSSDLIHDDAPGVRTEVLYHLATRAGLGTAPSRR